MLQDVLLKEKKKYNRLFVSLSILTILVIVVSVSLGDVKISISEIINIISSKYNLGSGEISEFQEAIVWDIRLPRVLVGVLIGAGLAVAGAIFQSILRNPLADPYTIGVSTGAAFGAVLVIYLNMVYSLFIPIMPVAFIFALATLFIIVKIAGFKETLHSSRLILAGIIISAILSAGISLIKSMAGEDVSAMIFWLMGSLSAKSWNQVLLLFPIITIVIVISHHYADDLDILTLGVNEAKSVGVDGEKRIKLFLVLAALLTAVCVSVSGIIGFIGLVIPHLIRMSFFAKHKYLIPISALVGGIMLSLADNISRLMFAVEIPVGVLTTLIGGPFFIYIYLSKKGRDII